MKVIGITHTAEGKAMYIKPDSALLVGGKPFFLPHFSEQIAAHVCLTVRINRLGRCIEKQFANRYYDSVTLGINLQAADLMTPPYSLDRLIRATGFDNSLVVGEWMPTDCVTEWTIGTEAEKHTYHITDLVCSIDEAVSEISQYITIRMGDMIAVDFKDAATLLHKEEEWRGKAGQEDVLYCKIK